MTAADFMREAKSAYVDINRKTLEWMLARPPLRGAFLNTKFNPLTLRDYGPDDGWRAPDILFGWIQGRGLEALMRHARFFEAHDPALSDKLLAAAEPLYRALAALHARDRHAYFAYDGDLRPIIPGADGRPVSQAPARGVAAYADIFVAKGLLAASQRFEPSAVPSYLADIASIVAAVEDGRFMIDEKRSFYAGPQPADADEYGPRMILLSAASLLRELGFPERAEFAARFVDHIVSRHMIRDARDRAFGLLRDAPDADRCNPGHAIEFVGFALECDAARRGDALLGDLDLILKSSFRAGFREPGILLGVSASTLEAESDLRPWWSLPEAMRTAALLYRMTRDPETLDIWKRLHASFLKNFWIDSASVAYQMRDGSGPVDHPPATPDLDPGYHTGLSFLSTIGAIDDMLRN